MTLATYVLVHGGAHGGWCYGPVARALRAAGHEVHTPTLTGVGDRSHLLRADIAAPLMDAARRDMREVDGIELVLFPGTEPMPNYGVTEPDDIAWMSARLTPHPWKCFTQPLKLANEAALWEIPQSVICCTSNLAFRDPLRLQRARDAGRVWDIDTGHDLMISEPDAVAELLLRVAAAHHSEAQYGPPGESRH